MVALSWAAGPAIQPAPSLPGGEAARRLTLVEFGVDEAVMTGVPFGERRLAAVHRAPDPASPRIGEIVAKRHRSAEHGLGMVLEFRPAGGSAPRLWMDRERIGDWGYGIRYDGAEVSGQWVRAWDAIFPDPAWIDGTSLPFIAFDGPIEGQVLELSGPAPLPAGSFVIVRAGERAAIRPETKADGPCRGC